MQDNLCYDFFVVFFLKVSVRYFLKVCITSNDIHYWLLPFSYILPTGFLLFIITNNLMEKIHWC